MSPTKVLVGLGSNSPEAKAQMERAVAWLSTILTQARFSPIYSSNSNYLNAVAEGMYGGTMQEFETAAKAYERTCGRLRGTDTVAIDVDLVKYGSILVRAKELERPHFQQGLALLP